MAIWEIKRFLNKDKDLTLDDLLAAKVVCKGVEGMTFEFTNKDGVYPKFTITLEASDEDFGGRKGKIISIKPGSYSIKVTSSSASVTVDLDNIKAGDLKTLNYVLDINIASYLTPNTYSFTVPDNLTEIYVTAIAGGANGGANIDKTTYDELGGAGGGGAGEKIIKQKYTVSSGQQIQVKVGNVKQATVIGNLVTLQPGVDGGSTVTTSGGKGGTIDGQDGSEAESSRSNGGKGGAGGPGIDENGKPVAAAAGGAGGTKYPNVKPGDNGENAKGYGGGGGGGGGKSRLASSESGKGGKGKAGMCLIFKRISIA